MISALISIILTLSLLLACGYLCRRIHLIDQPLSKGLSRLIMYLGQPMLIVASLAGPENNPTNTALAWKSLIIGFVVHGLLALAAFLICRHMKREAQTKIFEFSLVFANCGFIGFPLMDAIMNSKMGSFMGAFYFVSFHFFLWTWGIMILGRDRDDIVMTPRKAILNFGTIPCAIGIALYFLKPIFEVPPFLINFVDYLGGLCTPISVLVTGGLLATIPLRKMFLDKKLYLHSLIKLLILPLLFCVLARLCGLDGTFVLLITAMVGVPSASAVTMLAEIHDVEPGYASETVGMTSILSILTLPVVMMFAQWIISI